MLRLPSCAVPLDVRNDNHKPKLVKPAWACGSLDLDDPQPSISVMLPDEG
jgi:hypothetical protein